MPECCGQSMYEAPDKKPEIYQINYSIQREESGQKTRNFKVHLPTRDKTFDTIRGYRHADTRVVRHLQATERSFLLVITKAYRIAHMLSLYVLAHTGPEPQNKYTQHKDTYLQQSTKMKQHTTYTLTLLYKTTIILQALRYETDRHLTHTTKYIINTNYNSNTLESLEVYLSVEYLRQNLSDTDIHITVHTHKTQQT